MEHYVLFCNLFLPDEQILPGTNTVNTASYEFIFTYDITVNTSPYPKVAQEGSRDPPDGRDKSRESYLGIFDCRDYSRSQDFFILS